MFPLRLIGGLRVAFCLSMGMKAAKVFRPAGMPTRKEQNRRVDRWRGSASERGYNHRWSKARDTHLRNHPLCLGCNAVGLVTAAKIVDHVDPHHGDPVKFWDTGMWQSCCEWHHNSIKQTLEDRYAKGAAKLDDLWLNSDMAKRLTLGASAG